MNKETDVIELWKAFFSNPIQYENICDEILTLTTDHFLFAYVEGRTGIITVIHGLRTANIEVKGAVGGFRSLCARFAITYAERATEKPDIAPLYGFKGRLFFEPTTTYFDMEVKNVMAAIYSIEIRLVRDF